MVWKDYEFTIDNSKAEDDLWKSSWQEPKQSQYGGMNLRYRSGLKRQFINQNE